MTEPNPDLPACQDRQHRPVGFDEARQPGKDAATFSCAIQANLSCMSFWMRESAPYAAMEAAAQTRAADHSSSIW